jgi:hypothetical protein
MRGFTKRQLSIPSAIEAAIYRCCTNVWVKQLNPLRHTHCFSSHRNQVISSRVSSLNCHCCPATIFLAVVTIIIYTINRELSWAFSHIAQKVLKLHPAVANMYSASTVVVKGRVRWIRASLNHRVPDAICCRLSFVFAMPMRYAKNVFEFFASARYGIASNQKKSHYLFLGSALAPTQPTYARLSAIMPAARKSNHS